MIAEGPLDKARPAPVWASTSTVAWAALAYCLFFLILRNLLSPTIAVDDVEALIAVQDLRMGYRLAQPPLHGWLLWLVSEALGPGLLALSLIKYGLLFGTILLFHAAARRLAVDPRTAVLATVSLALIYLIGYQVHRGYTHTAVLMFTCSATFYLFVRLRERRTLLLYALFGLAAGLGLLSKYNYLGFLVALLIAGFATPAWRPALLDRRMLLAAIVFVAVVLPYLTWVAVEAHVLLPGLLNRRLPDADSSFLATRAAGFGQVLRAYADFLLPFIVIVPLVFPVVLRRGAGSELWRSPAIRLMTLQFAAGFAFLLLVVLISGTSAFKGRHLHPLLMFTPILVFLIVERQAQLHGLAERSLARRTGVYLAVAAVATLGTTVALAVRATQAPPDCGKCRLQQPYPALAAYLRDKDAIGEGTLIAGDEFIGGNLRAGLPDLRVYSVVYPAVVPPAMSGRAPGVCLIVWDGDESAEMPEKLASFAAELRGADDIAEGELRTAQIPFARAPTVTRSFRYTILPAKGDCT